MVEKIPASRADERFFGEYVSGKSRVFEEYPLSHPLNASTGAGFARMLCKILSGKGLKVKILSTDELDPRSRFLRARLRLDDDLRFEFLDQGQMSHWVVENRGRVSRESHPFAKRAKGWGTRDDLISPNH